MTVIQNAFANTSSSLVMGKVIGHHIDILMPPISAGEMVTAYTLGGITRGFAVGICTFLAVDLFVGFDVYSFLYTIFYLFIAASILSLFGLLVGVLSSSFEHMTAFTSYVVMPLSFLSGTFYPVKSLPESLYIITHLNPFFYMIDGFRYAITGYHDGNILFGIIFLIVTNALLWLLVQSLFAKGWRLKY